MYVENEQLNTFFPKEPIESASEFERCYVQAPRLSYFAASPKITVILFSILGTISLDVLLRTLTVTRSSDIISRRKFLNKKLLQGDYNIWEEQ